MLKYYRKVKGEKMAIKYIHTENAPAAVGPYSQATLAGDTLYVSGQIPFDPKTMKCVEGGIKEQTRQSLTNIKAIVTEAGYTMEDIVKCGIFLKDMGTFKDMNEVYAEFFKDKKPARFAVQAAELPLGVLVEIDAIAWKK